MRLGVVFGISVLLLGCTNELPWDDGETPSPKPSLDPTVDTIDIVMSWDSTVDVDLHVVQDTTGDYANDMFSARDCWAQDDHQHWYPEGHCDHFGDSTEFGPEEARVSELEDPSGYVVIMHMSSGSDFTEVSVTIQTPSAVDAATNTFDQQFDAWAVASIEWPSGDITRLGDTFYRAPP